MVKNNVCGSTFDVHPHHLSAQGGVPLLRDGRCSMGYLFGPMFILAASTLIAFSIAFTAPVFRVCLVEDGSRACFFDDDTADVSSEADAVSSPRALPFHRLYYIASTLNMRRRKDTTFVYRLLP
jgi:hypothetical protein